MDQIKTLKQLLEVAPVYGEFVTISDCNIPDYYKGIFPHYCKCGAEMIITEPGHTQLQCCDPDCWVKMGHRLAYFISKLGFKGFGETSALSLVEATHDRFKYPTFLSAFLLDEMDMSLGLNDYYTGLFCDIRDAIHDGYFQFPDAIAALGIPGVGSRSTLFDVVKSPVVLVQYMLQNRMNEICDCCGIQAPMTRFQLGLFKLDVLTLVKDVMPHIADTPKGEVFVAITGKVSVGGKYYNRMEFISLCESLRDKNGAALYKIVETKAASKLQYVIADEPSTSDKYSIGQKLGILITADEFYAKLKAPTEEETEQKEEDTTDV